MPETRRSPNLSHKPVPYTAICHNEEDEEEGGWSDDAEEEEEEMKEEEKEEEERTGKKLINVNEEGYVAVKGNGLEKSLMANWEERQDVDKFWKQKDVLPKNGLRQLHERRTMETVKEVQQERKEKQEKAETVL